MVPSCSFRMCKFIYLFLKICLLIWLCWVFVAVPGLSPVAASGGCSWSRFLGLSRGRAWTPGLWVSAAAARAQ